MLSDHGAPLLADNLAPDAPPERLDAVETEVGFAVPAQLRELWSIHDGQKDEQNGFVGALDWFGTQLAVAEREDVIYFLGFLREDRSDWGEAGVTEAEAMSDAWLPFAGRGHDRLVVSCVSGRVFTCEKDVPPLWYVDDSIVAWLEAYAARVESGAYAVKKGFGDYYLSRTDGMHRAAGKLPSA